jgi:hypothetical protein
MQHGREGGTLRATTILDRLMHRSRTQYQRPEQRLRELERAATSNKAAR